MGVDLPAQWTIQVASNRNKESTRLLSTTPQRSHVPHRGAAQGKHRSPCTPQWHLSTWVLACKTASCPTVLVFPDQTQTFAVLFDCRRNNRLRPAARRHPMKRLCLLPLPLLASARKLTRTQFPGVRFQLPALAALSLTLLTSPAPPCAPLPSWMRSWPVGLAFRSLHLQPAKVARPALVQLQEIWCSWPSAVSRQATKSLALLFVQTSAQGMWSLHCVDVLH